MRTTLFPIHLPLLDDQSGAIVVSPTKRHAQILTSVSHELEHMASPSGDTAMHVTRCVCLFLGDSACSSPVRVSHVWTQLSSYPANNNRPDDENLTVEQGCFAHHSNRRRQCQRKLRAEEQTATMRRGRASVQHCR